MLTHLIYTEYANVAYILGYFPDTLPMCHLEVLARYYYTYGYTMLWHFMDIPLDSHVTYRIYPVPIFEQQSNLEPQRLFTNSPSKQQTKEFLKSIPQPSFHIPAQLTFPKDFYNLHRLHNP